MGMPIPPSFSSSWTSPASRRSAAPAPSSPRNSCSPPATAPASRASSRASASSTKPTCSTTPPINPGGPNTIEATAWHSHPLFTERAFFLHDVGVVLLSKAVKLSAGQYGKLPTQDQLDALQPSSHTTFTAVGYGLQQINPVFVVAEKIRMFAEPHLIQIDGGIVGDFSLLLSNNASTGGTCFGDSGGPNFVGSSNVIGGVTSFGLNGTCGGTGGEFRLDRQYVRDFEGQYLR